ncbi:hypothetical protein B566_EDAN001312 [Ephemera danica]|nr:hypothetical protein B566_EDAN001312 [Ephemera danica]
MNETNHYSSKTLKKRKKKSSYLARAKKFGKSGRFGHGSHVSEDTYNYFVRVVEINKKKFDTEQEREIFVANTFEQTIGQEVTLATNQFTSYAIEQLIPCATDESIEKFMLALASDLRPICCDIFASHVIQSLLKFASDRVQELSDCEGEASVWLSKHMDWILKVGRFLLNNIDEFAWETYANPVMRTVLEVISGGVVTHSYNSKEKVKKIDPELKPMVPKLFKSLLKDYCKLVTSLPQLSDLTTATLTSGLLQSLVQAAARLCHKQLVPLYAKLIEVLKSKESFNDANTRLLEMMLHVAPENLYSQLFETFFQGNLKLLSCESRSNFSVQRLFDSCPSKEQLELLLEEVGSATVIEEILNAGNTGVILAMGQACERLKSGQGTFIQNLTIALQCETPEQKFKLAPLVLALMNHTKYQAKLKMREEGDPPLVTLQGSLLLQTLLNFNRPIKVVQSLLAMEPSELTNIFCDSKGSHVADSFMSSTYVGEKSREKLCHHLKGRWTEIACNIWGSRCLDATWRASTLKSRQNIVSELAQHVARLKSDKYGRFIVQEYGVDLYRHKPGEWIESQGQALRKKKKKSLSSEEPRNKKVKSE